MNIKKTLKNTLATGAILAGSIFGAEARADENCQPCGENKPAVLKDIRLRSETTLAENKKPEHKLTFGLADNTNGQRGEEYFRAYQHLGNEDYTSLAFNLPKLTLGDLESSVQAFGTFGDIKGIGMQSTHTFGNLTGVLNLEKNFTDDATRAGFGLDYKTGKWIFGGAFDTQNTEAGRTNQFLVKAINDLSETDQIGLGYVHSNSEAENSNSLAGFWCHLNDSWGTRSRIRYDWNDQGSRSIGFDSIMAQNPTFGRLSSPWIVGRNIGDMYDLSVVEDPLGPERVPLGERTKGGLVGEIQGSFDLENHNNSWIRGDIGNRFQQKDWAITPTIFYQHNFSGSDKAGASVLVHPKKIFGGNLCIEATYTNSLGNGDDDFYLGLQYSCPIGAPQRR